MTSDTSQVQRWKARRWLLSIGIVFAGQVGLIFLLGEHSSARARSRSPMPTFRLSSPAASELLAISDPTLFALPHSAGFSGRAWLHGFSPKLPSFEWSESPQWLPLPVAQLGQAFKRFMETNQAHAQPFTVAEAELTIPEISSEPVLRTRSVATVAGEASHRRLLTPIQPKSWAHPDLLTNTVVQFLVDELGRTFSPKVLLPGSGLKEADQYALDQIRAARFESIAPNGPQAPSTQPRWIPGEIIFQWHTLPMPSTNAPAPVVSP